MLTEQEFKDYQAVLLKKARMQAVMFGLAAVVTVIAVVYAAMVHLRTETQQEMADREMKALQQKIEVTEAKLQKCESGR